MYFVYRNVLRTARWEAACEKFAHSGGNLAVQRQPACRAKLAIYITGRGGEPTSGKPGERLYRYISVGGNWVKTWGIPAAFHIHPFLLTCPDSLSAAVVDFGLEQQVRHILKWGRLSCVIGAGIICRVFWTGRRAHGSPFPRIRCIHRYRRHIIARPSCSSSLWRLFLRAKGLGSVGRPCFLVVPCLAILPPHAGPLFCRRLTTTTTTTMKTSALLFASTAAGHALFQQLWVDGKDMISSGARR